MTIYLVDSENGQVKASTKVVGSSARRGLSVGYHGGLLGGLTGDFAGMKNDNVGKACEDAVGKAVEFLTGQLETIPWEGSVVLVKDGSIVINRGSREGVAARTTFDVGSAEQLVDPDTGEVLDSDLKKVATVQVTEVKEKISYCKVTESSGQIEKGMSIFPK